MSLLLSSCRRIPLFDPKQLLKSATLVMVLLLAPRLLVMASDSEEHAQSSGTGFVVNRQGHILTNHHVVDGCVSIRATTEGKSKELIVVGIDEKNDLAVLRMTGRISSVARFREGRSIRPGDSVVVVGYPLHRLLASEANVTTGAISALAGVGNDARFLQMTAPVQPGSSGGPLLDQSGLIVGIVEGKLNSIKLAIVTGDIPQNVNFAINTAVTRAFLDAYNIKYETAVSGKKLESADIGENAKRFTLLLQCYSETVKDRHRRLEVEQQALKAEQRAFEARYLAEARLEQEKEELERKAQLKEEANHAAAEYQASMREKESANLARFKAEAASERDQRFQEEERARGAKREAERQALNMEPQFLEETRRKGQEARARALSPEPEAPEDIPKGEAQQAATLPTVKTPETTLKISGAAGSSPYWARVQAIISSQWEPPPVDLTGQTYTTIVKFRLQRDGTIKDVVVQQSSGNAYFDMAGQRAVLRPRVMPIFPADMAESYKDVEIVFRVGESPG